MELRFQRCITVPHMNMAEKTSLFFKEENFRVLRVYRKNLEECELSCTEKVGDRDAEERGFGQKNLRLRSKSS